MTMTARSGRRGKDIRSDCWVQITLVENGGRSIALSSKVDVLYGRSIRALVDDVLAFFSIDHAAVEVEDAGALPYTIAARVEAAVRRLHPEETREYLLPAIPGTTAHSARDRFRRSRLYLPGNDPKLAINAGIHQPDGVILDLEDSVAPDSKDDARILVRNTLRAVDFQGAERMVRINQLPLGYEDLRAVVPQSPQLLLIPKCETARQVQEVDAAIGDILRERNLKTEIYLMPIIESALGALNALEIATASTAVVALAIGLEDYTADIGAERTLEGRESQWMRGAVVNAARAAGIQPIDTVFSDVGDMDGLRASAKEARSLGFDGKGCIHPRQIPVVHDAFAPDEQELARAKKIVLAFEDAERRGLGVVALGSKMIDPPVVKRAQRTITIALKAGLLAAEWREEDAHA
ncbi:MAG: citrate lyase ACP [Ignavibacteria bacterium]|nr:citrate lyase ACP [Ignavibacteria bacterium]